MKTETSKRQTTKKTSQTKTNISKTETPIVPELVKEEIPEKNKGGRPPKLGIEPPKWTIRGVDTETRAIIDKAASKRNQTLGEFFNQDIREYCTGQIKKSQQPPASPTDVKDMIAAELATFRTDILQAIASKTPDKKTFAQKLKELFQ